MFQTLGEYIMNTVKSRNTVIHPGCINGQRANLIVPIFGGLIYGGSLYWGAETF